jgi:hypothetical protein
MNKHNHLRILRITLKHAGFRQDQSVIYYLTVIYLAILFYSTIISI